uniref:Bestrophin homolog n=1 Tax=Panagrellus redivivus TaxID=6233 RepID=A0A7E4V650_PANRE
MVLIPHFSLKLIMPRFRHSAKPINDLHNVRQACPQVEESRSLEPEKRDQLYITDDETVSKWASKKVFVFRTFKILYWLVRWLFDGSSFSPTWHSVLSVDEVIKMGRPICVSDTLVLHCQSIEAFEKVIPYICGPYTRLMIHGGSISLDQLKRLMKDTVRKVEITANIQLRYSEYNDAVQLIMQHVRETRDNFNLESSPQLITEVKSAIEGDRYLRLFAFENEPNKCNVVHWKMEWIVGFQLFLAMNYLMVILGRPLARIVARHYGIELTSPIRDDILFVLDCVLNIFHYLLMIFLALRFALTSKPN